MNFKQHFQTLIIVAPKEIKLSISIGTFLTNYDFILQKASTARNILHCTKNEQNEREIIQWRLLILIIDNFFHCESGKVERVNTNE